MSKPRIIFRADGNNEIGLGHVIRSLALADMLNNDFECVFATRLFLPSLKPQIESVCDQLIELPKDDSHFEEFLNLLQKDCIVVLDNYFFDTRYQKRVKQKGCRLVCIDDLADKHFMADMVINHSPKILAENYSKEIDTQLLLGLNYILLRKEFFQEGVARDLNRDLKSVFVCFGGADPDNLTCKVVRCLLHKKEQINVVVGAGFLFDKELQTIESRNEGVKVYSDVDSGKMVDLIQNSDYGVIPSSGILLECLALKLPVLSGYYVENQRSLALFYKDIYPQYYLGDLKKLQSLECYDSTPTKNEDSLIDLKSPDRLRKAFNALSYNIVYREATLEDVRLIFDWSNEDEVRKQSFNSDKIVFENHQKWYSNKLKDPNCHFYICEVDGRPASLVRFEMNDDDSVVGILIDERYRGKGLAPRILMGALTEYQKSGFKGSVLAYIKEDNVASVKSFEGAGYQFKLRSCVNNIPCFVYKNTMLSNG